MDIPRLSSAKENWAASDRLLWGCVGLTLCLGIACIFSAASGFTGRGWDYAVKQAGWALTGSFACVCVMSVGYRKLLDLAYPLYGFALLALCVTLLIAPRIKGAHRWISLGPVRIQPSEFVKISLALVLSKFLSRYPPLTLKTFLGGVAVGLPAVLLVLLIQSDAGSAMVYIFIITVSLFVAGTPVKYLFSLAGAGVMTLPFAWMILKDYQKMRLLVFLDPTRDPLGAGYNALQSRIAVGSGGFSGKGFLQGMQSKLRFLPEPHTDFIFSVYAEEFGFWGASILLILFGIIFTRLTATALKSRDIRAKILVAGIAAWIWFQIFESIGMSMGIMPITGLPLPFLSYGGSSLVALFIALGIVGNVHVSSAKRYRQL